ncbi:MAG: Dam family site-specific DNA-(adenine-N6)-methyltransferase [Chloroflexota bacterium]|nr:Dam family site-specific DNA-(adenine-N6)-methyltransferase [Chloroflexota bacterium]
MLQELTSTTKLLKPPLKWAGGKRWLVPILRPYWDRFTDRRYVEPFCGGLATALGMQPQQALLNDLNPHLINFYEWLQRGLKIDQSFFNDSEKYYEARNRFNEMIRNGAAETAESAELFYYLNRTGYNGLCRFNRRGEFNVPFGTYKTINYASDFFDYVNTLSAWEFRNGDFQSIELQDDDFIYADPPYDVEFVSYSKEGFNWEDQERLAEWLAKRKSPVIISNQQTDRTVKLYTDLGFDVHYFDAPRRISSDGNRKPAKEVLALKNIGD